MTTPCHSAEALVPVPRCRVEAAVGVRRSELWMIKEVEELGAEFDVAPFSDGGLLEDRPVEVIDALLAQA